MINTIVTKLNSQLPDATIVIDAVVQNVILELFLLYTVSNFNSTFQLLSGTQLQFMPTEFLYNTTKQPYQLLLTEVTQTPLPFQTQF
jgi:hypothetical protein